MRVVRALLVLLVAGTVLGIGPAGAQSASGTLGGFHGSGSASGSDTAVDERTDGADLSRLSGAELEKAYIDQEVRFHEAVLATLDRDLIPSASSEALRDRLTDLTTELKAELQHARNIQHVEWIRKTAEQERADISKEISNDGP